MTHHCKSIRPFIGAADYEESRAFYRAMGFTEVVLSHNMCYFCIKDQTGFYLQDAYVKDWVDNTMLFMEVEDTSSHREALLSLELQNQFQKVRISDIVDQHWGREYFVHDPSGILWHIGEFH